MDRKAIGAAGEAAAVDFLARRGVTVVCRNYKTRRGELDIVGLDNGVLVFYEVKTSMSTAAWVPPEEALSVSQRHRIVWAARQYIAQRYSREVPCRFDVVTVRLAARGAEVRLITSAFMPGR